MNIAMLTTWASACGIAEYSGHLAWQFEQQEHNLLILNNKIDKCTHGVYGKSWWIGIPVFGVYWWGENPSFSEDAFRQGWLYAEEKFGSSIDVLVVQYQSSLYEANGFNWCMKFVKCPKVIALHDSSRNNKHISFDEFDAVIVHNPNIEHTDFLSMPVVETVPTVFSFGMGGRNNYQFISDACHEIGIDFYHHDGREHGWWDEEKLFNEMNNADAIVLWYNEVGIEGQSSALRTAISSMRPVIVNDVGWFKDVPSFVKKVKTKDELQITLAEILHIEYIRKNSYANCAKRYLEIINGLR